jgi:hypothetical protein
LDILNISKNYSLYYAVLNARMEYQYRWWNINAHKNVEFKINPLWAGKIKLKLSQKQSF